MRSFYLRHFTTPGHYLAVVVVVNATADGDRSDDWAAYIGAMALDLATARGEPGTLRQHVAEWGSKLSEEDARHFAAGRAELLALPYRP